MSGGSLSLEGPAEGRAEGPALRAARGVLIAIAAVAVFGIIVLPIADLILSRLFWKGIAPAGAIADHATLILAFAAAALASLDRRHISLAGGESARESANAGKALLARALASFGDVVAVSTQACLFWASLSLTLTGFDATALVWIFPTRVLAGIMPFCLALMAAFTIRNAGRGSASGTLRAAPMAIAALGLVLGSLLGSSSIRNFTEAAFGSSPAFMGQLAAAVQAFVGAYGIPLGILVVFAVPFGAPIFTVLGGIAAILFVGNGAFMELAPSEAYSLLKGGSISALPLFGIAGILLAESGAGKRFVAVFRELFGWFRGGEAIAAVLACAVFSTFTGINGVTIVALGGILATVLAQSGGLSENRSRGLITASGDIGLLIPPSAAVIVYGINAQFLYGPSEGFTIVSLFKGALVPGLILIAAMCGAGVLMSPKRAPAERSFSARASVGAIKPAALELLVPVAAILLYFTGLAGLREIGALSVLYIAIVESVVKKELGPRKLIAALGKAFPIVGGTLMVIAAARGLSFYLIDANVPAAFTAWIQAFVNSKFVFLLLLNLFLIVVGCLMDIFSAILVVSPFLIPLGVAFGVPPVQFGVIFIMNLLLGFLTPTVGMNIFLASYTFKKPIGRIVRDVWPFLIVQAAVLLLVTYVPALSTIFK